MAWWDHEELKPLEFRSLRYKLSFFEEYSKNEQNDILRQAFWHGTDSQKELAKHLAKQFNIKVRVKARAAEF